MDDIDRKILNMIQTDFPITSRPFLEVGRRLGIDEAEVISRIMALKDSGIIRRIGGSFDSRKLGFKSTLCAAKVPEDRVEEFNRVINSYPGITHNYTRDHEYNIWFTIIDESEHNIEGLIKEIFERTGIRDIISLPAKRIFKIRVDFEV